MKAIAVTRRQLMYPIQSPAQLAVYLKSLRKAKRLTQAQLGTMLGVTRARISEIENDPSNLGFSQLQRILHLLGSRLVIDTHATNLRPNTGSVAQGEW
jgi:HTH-type transcriptional regulator / antitoxin HipB